MKISAKKSVAIRIGSRFKSKCSVLHSLNDSIPWQSEAKYLGVHILSASNFKCNFDKSKLKFYKFANAIMSKLGNCNNKSVSLNSILFYSRIHFAACRPYRGRRKNWTPDFGENSKFNKNFKHLIA